MKGKLGKFIFTFAIIIGTLALISPQNALADSRYISGNFHYRSGEMRRINHYRPLHRTIRYDRYHPRHVMVVDRDDRRNYLNIHNEYTGPYSYNTVVVYVSDYTFREMENTYNINNDIDISVNTGNNTISFNTRTGNIETGDVNISIR